MGLKDKVKNVKASIKKNNETSSRKTVLEDLFYDFNRNQAQIYKMNFLRGIFFGFGSVLGGTIVVAILIWVLSLLGGVFPPLENFFNGITDTVDASEQ